LIQLVLVPEVVQPLLAGVVAAFLPGILFHMPLAVPFLTHCRFHQMPALLVCYQLAMNHVLGLAWVVAVEVLSVFVQNQLLLM
jgi:hypothetical protein